MVSKGYLVKEYLDRFYRVVERSLADYSRVTAVRFDLNFPRCYSTLDERYGNEFISRFIDNLQKKVSRNRKWASEAYDRAHQTRVRYAWAREWGGNSLRPHYHVIILVNGDAYRSLGRYQTDNENMRNRIQSSWASALGFEDVVDVRGLVNFCENGVFHVKRGDIGALGDLMFAASYMMKEATKRFGEGGHVFGCSRL